MIAAVVWRVGAVGLRRFDGIHRVDVAFDDRPGSREDDVERGDCFSCAARCAGRLHRCSHCGSSSFQLSAEGSSG